jgi:hypothetical protein
MSPSLDVIKTAGGVIPDPVNAGRFLVTYNLAVSNTGNVPIENVSVVDALDTVFAGGYTITSGPSLVGPIPTGFTLNLPGYTGVTGATAELIAPSMTLDVDEAIQISMTVSFVPGTGAAGPGVTTYTNAVSVGGLDPIGDPVSGGSSVEVTTVEAPSLNVTKTASAALPDPANAGRFITTYTLSVANTGNVPLSDVGLFEDLDTLFPNGWTVDVVGGDRVLIDTSAVPVVLSGSSTGQLLDVANSDLGVDEEFEVRLRISFVPTAGQSEYINTATATGTSPCVFHSNGKAAKPLMKHVFRCKPEGAWIVPKGGNISRAETLFKVTH